MPKLNELFDCDYDIELNDLKTNSKDVKEGDLFLCTMGVKADRHDYIDDAISKGAAAIIGSKDISVSVPYIKVDDTNSTLSFLAQKFYGHPATKLNLIGVTGTDGKTSTATIIHQIIDEFSKAGYIGTNGAYSKTFNGDCDNTTPPPEILHNLLNKFCIDECESVVMEVSSEALSYGRCANMEFDYSIFTNLSHEHLNHHKTMEHYLECKGKLFRQTKKDGYCIINRDDENFDYLKSISSGKVLSYGSHEEADFRFFSCKIHNDKTVFKLSYQGTTYDIETCLVGKFNIYNLTAALAVITLMGQDINNYKEILNRLFIPGRMNYVDKGQNFKVIVDYAHTPNGYINLFNFTKQLEKNRTIIVAGSAGERDRDKRPVMGEILVDNSDYVIFTYEDPRSEDPSDIIDDLTRRCMDKQDKFEKVIDRREAIRKAIQIAEEGDIIFILGKGSETYEILKTEKIYFNDIEEAEKALDEVVEKSPV